MTTTIPNTNPNIEDPTKAAYMAGLEAGLRMYAWWKDGCEYVGTCGRSLKTAIRDTDKVHGVECWHPGYHKGEDGGQYCNRCGRRS